MQKEFTVNGRLGMYNRIKSVLNLYPNSPNAYWHKKFSRMDKNRLFINRLKSLNY